MNDLAAGYIDITRPLHPGLGVWPGDPPFELDWAARRSAGDPVNLALVRFGVHAGTHVDAPYHVLPDGARIDEIAPDVFIGRALVADARGRDPIDRRYFESLFERAGAECPPRILLRTDAWRSADEFPSSYPSLTADGGQALADAGLRLLGTDAPSVDPIGSTHLPAHHVLLSAGICILENLFLDSVAPGEYDLIALPLRIRGADASPVRALLRPR